MQIFIALLAGLIFGVGLIVAGMTDPSKIIGFLDIAGVWNPSLAFVMVGGIAVATLAFRFAASQTQSFFGNAFQIPTATQIDWRLIIGSLLFGIGWGLAGYCPGPALASIATGGSKPVVFTLAMLGGMAIFELLEFASKKAR